MTIRKVIMLVFLLVQVKTFKGQTTAMSYDFIDCAGNPQSIYADLNSGKALILEFFMNSCSSCIVAGQKLEVMKADLQAQYPGRIKSYAFGFSNTYTCTMINNWVSTNGFTSIPADSGAAQTAYYGGMGMPTIVILGGGTSHSVLGTPYIGFTTSDTTTMANDIRNFLNSTASVSEVESLMDINLFPNPTTDRTQLEFTLPGVSQVKIEVIDLTGRTVKLVSEGTMSGGVHKMEIFTNEFSQGLYSIRWNVNGTITQKSLNVIH